MHPQPHPGYTDVITFAWLAIDPAVHYPRWERDDAQGCQQTNDGRSAAANFWIRASRRCSKTKKPSPSIFSEYAAARADKADEHWAQRLGFPAGDTPFGDTYDVIFKHCSSRTHASVQGLNDVLERRRRHRACAPPRPRLPGRRTPGFPRYLRPRPQGVGRDVLRPSAGQRRCPGRRIPAAPGCNRSRLNRMGWSAERAGARADTWWLAQEAGRLLGSSWALLPANRSCPRAVDRSAGVHTPSAAICKRAEQADRPACRAAPPGQRGDGQER